MASRQRVMCDLDKFKSVNDNYGHIAAKMLWSLQQRFWDTLRTNDLPGDMVVKNSGCFT